MFEENCVAHPFGRVDKVGRLFEQPLLWARICRRLNSNAPRQRSVMSRAADMENGQGAGQ
jgi:hypothetical protein